MRGQSDQRAAIVIGNNLYSRGQTAIGIQLCDFSLNARNDIVGTLGPPHHDDRCRDIIIVIPARDYKPWDVTDRDFGDILDLEGKAARLGQDNIFDVLNPVALGHVVRPTAVDQPDAADVHRLLSDRDLTAPDIDVCVTERGNQLRDGDIVGFELLRIRFHAELFCRSAPTADLDYPPNPHNPA